MNGSIKRFRRRGWTLAAIGCLWLVLWLLAYLFPAARDVASGKTESVFGSGLALPFFLGGAYYFWRTARELGRGSTRAAAGCVVFGCHFIEGTCARCGRATDAGFPSNLFSQEKGAEASAAPGEQHRDLSYEQRLKSEFGVDHGEGGWAFEGGRVVDNMVERLRDPHVCWGVLKGIRERLPFSQLCIVANPKMVVFVCNTKPTPTCIETGLNASGLGGFVAAAVMEAATVEVHENGPWLLTLEDSGSHEKVLPPALPVVGASLFSQQQASRPRRYKVVRGWIVPVWLLLTLNIYSMFWLYRVFRELHTRKATDLSPGKAVGYMFIPFFNLVWIFIAWKKLGDAITSAYSQARLNPPATGIVWLPPISFFVMIGLNVAAPPAGFALAIVLLSIALCTIQGWMNRLAAVEAGGLGNGDGLGAAALTPAIAAESAEAALPSWSPPCLADPDQYERRCLTVEFHEEAEERTFRSDSAFADVLAAFNSRRFDDAVRLGKKVLPRFRDFDLPWDWVSSAYQEKGQLDAAFQVAVEGLARAKRKSVLLTRLGDIEWQRGNLPEAVYALSQVLHCYADRPLDYNPYLLLSYVSEGVGLSSVEAAFRRQVDRLRGGTVRLPDALADRLRGLSRGAQSPAIAQVLEGLSEKYLKA